MIIRDNFLLILHKNRHCPPYLNRLIEKAQMRGHNMFSLRKFVNYPYIIIKYPLLSRAALFVNSTIFNICALRAITEVPK